MKLRRRHSIRAIFASTYVIMFIAYIIIGLQPAEATNYDVSAKLLIPSIGLSSDVTTVTLIGNKLETPDTIVGSYSAADNKTLLFGHSSTVFHNLDDIKIGDLISYDNNEYRIVMARLALKESIEMEEIMAGTERDTIVIMTCAGEDLGGGDATHRLIIYAEAE